MADKVRKSTMIELVDELRLFPKSEYIDYMIMEALEGQYHDYKNSKYICGKMEAAQKLEWAGNYLNKHPGYKALAARIRNGEFDEEADSDDIAMMKNDLANHAPKESADALADVLGLNRKS